MYRCFCYRRRILLFHDRTVSFLCFAYTSTLSTSPSLFHSGRAPSRLIYAYTYNYCTSNPYYHTLLAYHQLSVGCVRLNLIAELPTSCSRSAYPASYSPPPIPTSACEARKVHGSERAAYTQHKPPDSASIKLRLASCYYTKHNAELYSHSPARGAPYVPLPHEYHCWCQQWLL